MLEKIYVCNKYFDIWLCCIGRLIVKEGVRVYADIVTEYCAYVTPVEENELWVGKAKIPISIFNKYFREDIGKQHA